MGDAYRALLEDFTVGQQYRGRSGTGIPGQQCREVERCQKDHTWPLQCGPAPMPIVGMESSRVAAAAMRGGTHSSTIAKQPASCNACSVMLREPLVRDMLSMHVDLLRLERAQQPVKQRLHAVSEPVICENSAVHHRPPPWTSDKLHPATERRTSFTLPTTLCEFCAHAGSRGTPAASYMVL